MHRNWPMTTCYFQLCCPQSHTSTDSIAHLSFKLFCNSLETSHNLSIYWWKETEEMALDVTSKNLGNSLKTTKRSNWRHCNIERDSGKGKNVIVTTMALEVCSASCRDCRNRQQRLWSQAAREHCQWPYTTVQLVVASKRESEQWFSDVKHTFINHVKRHNYWAMLWISIIVMTYHI